MKSKQTEEQVRASHCPFCDKWHYVKSKDGINWQNDHKCTPLLDTGARTFTETLETIKKIEQKSLDTPLSTKKNLVSSTVSSKSYFDLPESEKREILEQAADDSNKAQQELMKQTEEHEIGEHGAVGILTRKGRICVECKQPIANDNPNGNSEDIYLELLAAWGDSPIDEEAVKEILISYVKNKESSTLEVVKENVGKLKRYNPINPDDSYNEEYNSALDDVLETIRRMIKSIITGGVAE